MNTSDIYTVVPLWSTSAHMLIQCLQWGTADACRGDTADVESALLLVLCHQFTLWANNKSTHSLFKSKGHSGTHGGERQREWVSEWECVCVCVCFLMLVCFVSLIPLRQQSAYLISASPVQFLLLIDANALWALEEHISFLPLVPDSSLEWDHCRFITMAPPHPPSPTANNQNLTHTDPKVRRRPDNQHPRTSRSYNTLHNKMFCNRYYLMW